MLNLASELELACSFGGLTASVAEHTAPDGVVYSLEWVDAAEASAGRMRIEVRPPEARFVDLSMEPPWRRKGVYGTLCARIPPVLRRAGLTRVVAAPATRDSTTALTRGGLMRQRHGLLGANLADPANRIEEYARFKQGVAPEPIWHHAMRLGD